MSTKKALKWVMFWIGLALIFNLGIYVFKGKEPALEFLGGFVIEKSLSIDNLFLFIMVFSSFGIKLEYQRRVLNYGILGALILRLIFVLLGVTIVNMFHWVLYVFGAILIISGVRMIFNNEDNNAVKDSKIIKILGKIIPVTDKVEGDKFFVRKNKILYATPLFAVLILIEFTDIIFAVDSIPAIFSVTTDPFIVYTSNIFAILGLRSMYFVLGNLHEKFKYVKYGVALILVFTGVKLSVLMFDIKIPIELSVGIIFFVLASSIILSVLFSGRKKEIKQG
ncbi:TerC/Alx family metal homeostasis membrane protein [Ruminiclostridium cellulolyticum]|uniref:Integral membrane protein TerC n=1 Tax=Ruminiclostridium cellulolyticum (strain ATCC 35319 / DSM 5812 / JCM 6584 / H10) TaxID=394503 RepID=B8I2K5_RUMCH|nr:TerC/Alx family metal homeostasis membrane protein [Ruminiclostridium cellulolyticum]ACL75998.1 Integral membrane protein TerC [Ruminiclostridium cellulolyticum H10]